MPPKKQVVRSNRARDKIIQPKRPVGAVMNNSQTGVAHFERLSASSLTIHLSVLEIPSLRLWVDEKLDIFNCINREKIYRIIYQMPESTKYIGKILKEARVKKGLSQRALSGKTKIPQNHILEITLLYR